MKQSKNIRNMLRTIGNDMINIYTDGGCHNTDVSGMLGRGSWAFVEFADDNDLVEVRCGGLIDTTNNRTEMLAVINAIKFHPEHTPLNIISDSGYLVKGYNHPAYLDAWIKRGWRTSTGDEVKNQDLWQELIALTYRYPIKFQLIKGHDKDPNPVHAYWNSIVDKACTHMIKSGLQIQTTMTFNVKEKRFII